MESYRKMIDIYICGLSIHVLDMEGVSERIQEEKLFVRDFIFRSVKLEVEC